MEPTTLLNTPPFAYANNEENIPPTTNDSLSPIAHPVPTRPNLLSIECLEDIDPSS